MKNLFSYFVVLGLLAVPVASAAEEEPPPKDSGRPEPLELLRLGDLLVNLEAQLQLMAFWVDEDGYLNNGDPGDASGFRVRRARLGVSGEFVPTVSYSLLFSFVDQEEYGGRDAGSEANEDLDSVLHEALVQWQPLDEVGLVVGSAKLPFARAQLDSSKDLLLIERPRCVSEIAPDRRLGLALTGGFWEKRIQYTGGLFNSTPGFFRGPNTEGEDLPFGGLVAARLEFHPLGVMAGGQSDFQREDPLLRVGADVFWDDPGGGTQELAASGDLAFHWYGLALQAEFLWSKREPTADVSVDLPYSAYPERNGWYVQLGYLLDPAWLGVGLELAFRFEQYDDNHSAQYRDHGDQRLITGGLNAYFLDGHLKLQVNYVHRQELFDPAVDDDAAMALVQWRL